MMMLDNALTSGCVCLAACSCNSSRRRFLKKTSSLLFGGAAFCSGVFTDNSASAGPTAERAADADTAATGDSNNTRLIDAVERCVIFAGRGSTENWGWFHPRACMVPTAAGPLALMTLQTIAGSDYFFPIHFTVSKDLGKSWTQPQPVPGMGRRPAGGGLETGVCDVVPEYHTQTDTVLAIGHTVHYKDGRLARPQNPTWPVYAVRDAEGNWSALQKLVWDDPRGAELYSCGCGQRTFLPNGDLLIPLYFADTKLSEGGRAKVAVALALFDGRRVVIRRVGNVLNIAAGRGLLEPSLTVLDGTHYMTIRAEDNRGYVTTSADGLNWAPIRPWAWEDGAPLEMSTTQQHWLTHSDGLFLVYTRKTPYNKNVMRWRAPLLAAQVDRKTLRLLRDTEIDVLPLVGDAVNAPNHVALMGNFHVTSASPHESWVTVGENMRNDNYRGDTLLARVRWARKNRLIAD